MNEKDLEILKKIQEVCESFIYGIGGLMCGLSDESSKAVNDAILELFRDADITKEYVKLLHGKSVNLKHYVKNRIQGYEDSIPQSLLRSIYSEPLKAIAELEQRVEALEVKVNTAKDQGMAQEIVEALDLVHKAAENVEKIVNSDHDIIL